MATIQSSFKLMDNMTRPLQHITSAMGTLINTMETMQRTSERSIDTTALQSARDHIAQANVEFDRLEQNIRDASDAERDFNRNLQEASSNAEILSGKLKSVLATVSSIATIKIGLNWASDNMKLAETQRNAENQLAAVLANMGVPDVTVPITADTTQVMSAYDAITKKASEIQAKGIYGDEAMIAGAAELSTYFQDADAILSMMDTLSNYAMGMSGGGELDSKAMTDYATNIGKIMSGAYDAMTKKGFEFTDAQKAVIEGTATQAQYVEALGSDYQTMSDEMRAATVINDIIAESWDGLYETMSNTPEGKIIQFKNSLGDLRETLGNQIYPYVLKVYDAFSQNFPKIETILTALTTGLGYVVSVLSLVASAALTVGNAVVENWGWIEPILWGIIGALVVYNATMGIAWLTTMKDVAAKAAHAIASAAETAAIIALTIAQDGLNAALALCPLTWIIMAVVAIIALIAAVCSWIAKTTHVAGSGFGVITGGINVVIQAIKNAFLVACGIANGIYEAYAAVCKNIMTAFHNAISSVQSWFYNLMSTALSVIENICAALNKLPFVNFDFSGISAKANEYARKSAEAAGNKEEYTNIANAFSAGYNKIAGNAFSSGWASNAFKSGAAWGDSVADKVSGLFSGYDMSSLNMRGSDALSNYSLGNQLNDIAGNTGATADNTKETANALKMNNEELKLLREIAEREAINKFTTAEIKVELTNNNSISSNDDIDGFIERFTTKLQDAVIVACEGVHV